MVPGSSTTPCVQCRTPLPFGARFCNVCGSPQPPASTPEKRGEPAPAPKAAPNVASPAVRRFGAQTVLGVAAPSFDGKPAGAVRFGGGGAQSPPAQVPAPAARPADARPYDDGGGRRALHNATMVGVAVPGVAPRSPQGAQQAAAPLPPPAALPAPAPHSVSRAPTPPPAWVPPEARVDLPRSDTPSGPVDGSSVAPRRARRRAGLVIAAVALLAIAGVGATIAIVMLRGNAAPELRAELRPAAGGTGSELLVRCDGCSDGERVDLGLGRDAAFASGQAVVAVPEGSLHAGENTFDGSITPLKGDKRTISLSVDVPFLLHPSLAPLARGERKFEVDVDVGPNVRDVEIDGQRAVPTAGRATVTLAIPAPADATGTEGTATAPVLAPTIDRAIEYEIGLVGGARRKGTLHLTVSYAPLRLALPGIRAIVVGDDVELSGRTAPGASVRLGADAGAPVVIADRDGLFRGHVKLPTDADSFDVSAFGPKLAARTAHVSVLRAASIADGARALQAGGATSFAVAAGAPREHVGEVTKAKIGVQRVDVEDGRTVVVGDAVTTPGSDAVLAVARLPAATTVKRGDTITVVGVIAPPLTSAKGAVSAIVIDASAVTSVTHE